MPLKKDNVVALESAVTARHRLGRAEGPLVASCDSACNRHLKRLLQDLFDNVDDALFERADKARNNIEADLYFDAMRAVRRQRNDIEERFLNGFLAQYRRFCAPGGACTPPPPNDLRTERQLSLIDETEVEESLAITNMVTKAKNLYRERLFILAERLSHLKGGRRIDSDDNPLGPSVICHAFQEALRPIEVDLRVKLVIYKLFDRYVLTAIDPLYEEINSLFLQAGVLPDLRSGGRPGRKPSNHGASLRTAEAGHAPRERDVQGSPRRGLNQTVSVEVFETLRSLLARQPSDTSRSPRETPMPNYPAEEVLGALSNLQHTNPRIAGAIPIGGAARTDLKTVLLHTLPEISANDEPRALGQVEESAIDIVEMLFEFILDDPNLQDGMKALLSRLQIPILKVAILDKSFFGNARHAARRLLNELARAAIGWTEADGRGPGTMYARVENTVNRVLREFQSDVGVYTDVLESFRDDLQRERKSCDVIESRATQAAQGKERLELAKRDVNKAIEERMQGRTVPQVIDAMLRDGWHNVMVLIHLRQGIGSNAWTKGLDVIEALVWSAEPKGSAEERRDLIRRIPSLLRELREGLSGISFDPHRVARFFKELQDIHLDRLRGNAVVAESPLSCQAVSPRRAPPDETETAIPMEAVRQGKPVRTEREAGEGSRRTAERFNAMADQLRVGAWLEFRESDGRQTRAKLAWKSDLTTTCLFVNDKGLKVAEKTTSQIADALRAQQASIIDEIPLIDRTLEAMMHALKGNEASRSDR